MAAGYGTSPYFVFSGYDEHERLLRAGRAAVRRRARPAAGRRHRRASWWPLFRSTPIEYVESYYPLLIEPTGPCRTPAARACTAAARASRRRTGSWPPARSRSTTTARSRTPGASAAGATAASRQGAGPRDGRIPLPSKLDNLKVHRATASCSAPRGPAASATRSTAPRTAWPRRPRPRRPGRARGYGVVFDEAGAVDESATAELRERLRPSAASPRCSTSGTLRASRSASTRPPWPDVSATLSRGLGQATPLTRQSARGRRRRCPRAARSLLRVLPVPRGYGHLAPPQRASRVADHRDGAEACGTLGRQMQRGGA